MVENIVEHGLCIIKKDFFDIIKKLGGDCDTNNRKETEKKSFNGIQ